MRNAEFGMRNCQVGPHSAFRIWHYALPTSPPPDAQPPPPAQRLGPPPKGAPRRPNGAPAVAPHVAHQPGGIAEREEGAAQQALGWEEELLDGLTHQGRGSRPHASPRAAPPHP